MPSAASLGLVAHVFFQVMGQNPGAWPDVLSCSGFQAGGNASIIVLRDAAGPAQQWIERLEGGAILILEGESELASALGFRATAKRVRLQSIKEARIPELRIVWEQAVEAPVFSTPPEAQVFTRERRDGAPLVAGVRRGSGAVLWVATSPGKRAFERYPYLLHALSDLGVRPPFRSRRLWAFFDSSYRLRADPDYLARKWRAAGIEALHVAAWHYYEPGEQRDEYLRKLIAACRRNAIGVYAWLELPHVGERFWAEHPQWREKTAVLQDAHLDWRKLMNLTNRECFRAVAAGVRGLLARFDWDGVNLAEMYFESLEGASNPARFTPMNDDVRREFRSVAGFDPLDLFTPGRTPGAARMRHFLDWRADLVRKLQTEWLEELEAVRREKPDLDLVLTHIDDRFDTGMRDALGADAAALLPAMDTQDFTFLIQDPATVWHLGPQRYAEIARRYQPLTRHSERLAIDLNIVERYQDVYPTKQQTGTELLQLVHSASMAFPRVALYFENSILAPDLPLLPAAAAAVTGVEQIGSRLAVTSRHSVRVEWNRAAIVDGRLWPAADGKTISLPAGTHVVEPAKGEPSVRLLDLNADIMSARALPQGVEFSYRSNSRAIAVVDAPVSSMELDGAATSVEVVESKSGRTVIALPRGQHLVRFECR